jgi:uncharacterized protein
MEQHPPGYSFPDLDLPGMVHSPQKQNANHSCHSACRSAGVVQRRLAVCFLYRTLPPGCDPPGDACPRGAGTHSLRILQISDLHVEYTTRRELELVKQVRDLEPDIIVLTGDYLNLSNLADAQSLEDVRSLLSQLDAPGGVYAVNGSVDDAAHMQAIFAGLDQITVLDDRAISLHYEGWDLYLVGVTDSITAADKGDLRSLMSQAPPTASSLLLYHTPDLIQSAAQYGVDFYLAGHTHGGQVRLPFYGAIITFSDFGKQYEQGLYHLASTTLYVSRGIGMEGSFAPRMRFLCPPELVLLELVGGPLGIPGAFSSPIIL